MKIGRRKKREKYEKRKTNIQKKIREKDRNKEEERDSERYIEIKQTDKEQREIVRKMNRENK